MRAVVLLTLALACVSAQTVQRGLAILRGTNFDSGVYGTVEFRNNANDVNLVDVFVNIQNITQRPNGLHGLHVHTWGDISDQAAALAAGPHWALPGEVHGCPPNLTRHAGDMGNWEAVNGVIVANATFDKLALTGVNSIIGRAVVLHNQTDDCTNITTNGMSGNRLAQGVIGIMNIANNTASNGSPKSTTGADIAICNLYANQNTVPIYGYGVATQIAGLTAVNTFFHIGGINANMVHAVHVHEFGDLTTNLTLGAHYNPLNDIHGMYGFPHHHAGDLGNLAYFTNVDNTNSAFNQTQDPPSFNTWGGQYNILGRGAVIHAMRDNCSNPIGASGSRYAICVWGIAQNQNGIFNLTVFNPPRPTNPVSTQYDQITIDQCNQIFNITGSSTGTSTGSSTGSATSNGATSSNVATATTGSNTGSAATIAFSAIVLLAALLF